MSTKKRFSLSDLSLQDVICPICLSILIEPVTMPCTHSLCMPCFNQHVAETSLACPVCRMRISVWVRRNTKTKRLVNTRLWLAIKEKFPGKIEARLQGADLDDEEFEIPVPRVSAPGEIRQEYEALIEREQKELASRRTQEEEASSRLIQELQEEEKMKLRQRQTREEVICKEDEALARQIKEAEKLVLEQKLKDLQMRCGSDEDIARRIEEQEKAKAKPASKLVTTPARGPMDIYIGQKTPKTQGKLLLPEVMPCLSKSSGASNDVLKSPGTQSSTPRAALDFGNTPSSSFASSGFYSQGSCNKSMVIPRSNSGSSSSNDCMDSKFGRSLREITSSQSSESEPEEFQAAKLKSHRQTNSSGKENLENCSPSKTNRAKSRSCSPLKLERKRKKLGEDSDETDMDDEDDLDFKMKDKRPSKTIEGRHNSQNNSSTSIVNKRLEAITNEASETDDNNSSLDYGLVFSNEELYSETFEKLKEEQLAVEERLRQEERDRLLAEMIQNQLNQELRQVNRARGSEDEYKLRDRTKKSKAGPSRMSQISPTGKRERQTTLRESMAKRFKKS